MGLIRNHLFMLSCIVADSLGSLVCKREGGKKKGGCENREEATSSIARCYASS